MARRSSTRTLRVYIRLLKRDIRRNFYRLITVRRKRGQLILTLTRPSFKTSRNYYRKWRGAGRPRRIGRSEVMIGCLLVGLGIGVTVYAVTQLISLQTSPPPTMAASTQAIKLNKPAEPAHMTSSVPERLSIPDVGIDTTLIQLGTNPDGSMETPVAYDVAGWYKHSPTPGEIGPAVLVGHVDNYQGPAVFFRLKELQPGQKIAVTRQDGSIATFVVTRLEQFDQDQFPTSVVYGNTDDAQLRVITCGGLFNYLTGRYSQNTVVFATYEPPTDESIDI